MDKKISGKKTRKIFKTGDSYAVTLPKKIIRELRWREKQEVKAELQGKTIVIKKS
jgi:antitoxin component of MazEF toxin-antitoxin module